MTETSRVQRTQGGYLRSAVGRLILLIESGDGTEKVTYERRWPNAESAREWCEDRIGQAPEGAAVLEIQVTAEIGGRRHAW